MSTNRRYARTLLQLMILPIYLVLFILLAGCGDDSTGSGAAGECTDCSHWTRITDDRGGFPNYFPDPAGTDRSVMAFSSDRGNDDNIENVWVLVRGEGDAEDQYFQITDSEDDEFDPAWSPDGTRLAYTRVTDERYDVYISDVTNFSDPGDPFQVTSLHPVPGDTLTLMFRPSGAAWLANDVILFSNGINIYTVTLDEDNVPIAVEKIIDDPGDYVLSNVTDFIEDQATGIRIGGSDKVYFVSDSREPLGAIEVTAVREGTEEIVEAEIFLEGSATSVTTPAVVGGRPLGPYVVGARVTALDAEDKFCDSMMTQQINVFENDTAEVHLEFNNPRGTIGLTARPLGSVATYDGRRILINADTVYVDCVFPSVEHLLKSTSIEPPIATDSACVTVLPNDTIFVTLIGHPDSVGLHGYDCSNFKLSAGSDHNKTGGIQTEFAVLWEYDHVAGAYTALSDCSYGPTYPAVSADGTRLAYVREFKELWILDLETGTESRVPLPGEVGVNICTREIAHPVWSRDGKWISVSLSPCVDRPSSDSNSTEFHVWEVNLESVGLAP